MLMTLSDTVAHKIYGVPQTINAANYVYFLAYQELFKFRRQEHSGRPCSVDTKGKARETRKPLDEVITGGVMTLMPSQAFELITTCDSFVEELLNLHRGQGLDLFWR